MADIKAYTVDHLFLIIGTSPLPNYAAACLLSRQNARVYLLHSAQTAEVSRHLADILSKGARPDLQFSFHAIDEADRLDIVTKTQSILAKIPATGAVGLNYTGGTKPMAAHIYHTVQARYAKAVFSYIDARRMCIVIDGQGSDPNLKLPIGSQAPISLEELAALHGRRFKNVPQTSADILYPQVSEQLIQLTAANPQAWREWCASSLRWSKKLPAGWEEQAARLLPECQPDKVKQFLQSLGTDDLKPRKQLESVALPESGEIAEIFKQFTPEKPAKNLPELCQSLFGQITSKTLEDLAGWLDGKWIEHHTLKCLEQIRQECGLNEAKMNLAITGAREFELDIAALRGYQLFAISCTTDLTTKINKSKLFEAFVRARQLGGEEARFGIVSSYDKPGELEKELREDWQAEGVLKVFGHADLPHLAQQLSHWIQNANQIG